MSKKTFNPADELLKLATIGAIKSFTWSDFDQHKYAKVYNPARRYSVVLNDGLVLNSTTYIKDCAPSRGICHPSLAKQSHRRILADFLYVVSELIK